MPLFWDLTRRAVPHAQRSAASTHKYRGDQRRRPQSHTGMASPLERSCPGGWPQRPLASSSCSLVPSPLASWFLWVLLPVNGLWSYLMITYGNDDDDMHLYLTMTSLV